MYGQMTAGSWIYIGTQGILQGTYETFAEAARQHFGGSLAGRLVLTAGLGGMGGAQPLAATMNEGVLLAVEVDRQRIERRLQTRYLDGMSESLDEALTRARAAVEKKQPLSIGLLGNAADVHSELVKRGVVPDLVTDQTSAHDPLNGYVPNRMSYEQALSLRRSGPDRYMAEARERTGLPIVTEVLSWEEVAVVSHFADMLQIGARNMQNFTLLRAAARSGKPVLLKRGAGATIEEWMMAAEYILAEGNPNVVLCERGIRTFERATRHTLDLNAVVMVKERTHLPVIVDPSHAAGLRSLVIPLSMGSLAAGACGLIVEVHPDPAKALSDGAQSLDLEMFGELAGKVHGPSAGRRGRWAGRQVKSVAGA